MNKIYISILLFLISNKAFTISINNTKRISEFEYSYAFTEGTKQYLFGNSQQALILYLQCIKYDKLNPSAYFQSSIILSENKLFDKALEQAKNAYELDKNNIWYGIN